MLKTLLICSKQILCFLAFFDMSNIILNTKNINIPTLINSRKPQRIITFDRICLFINSKFQFSLHNK